MLILLSRSDAARAPFTTADARWCYRFTRLCGRLGWRRRTYVDDEAADV